MNPLSDGWHHHLSTLPTRGLDARARAEIERAYYAGAEFTVDALVGMNDAGLMLPLGFVHQLSLWTREYSVHDDHQQLGTP